LLAKDAFKEILGGVLETRGRSESQRLGVAVFELLGALVRELLSSGASLIVEGNFRRGSPALAKLPPARIAQVHLTAPPGLIRKRLLERDPHRHPVHYDREAADEIADRATRGEWLPLNLAGVLIEVDTSRTVEIAPIVAKIRAL
jgi:predicted kinase